MFFYRFADGEFEQNLYEHRIHDVVTHQTTRRVESVVEYVNVTGAGILHNEKSPAVQSISRSPAISNMNITLCASDGINLISPLDNTRLLFNRYNASHDLNRVLEKLIIIVLVKKFPYLMESKGSLPFWQMKFHFNSNM